MASETWRHQAITWTNDDILCIDPFEQTSVNAFEKLYEQMVGFTRTSVCYQWVEQTVQYLYLMWQFRRQICFCLQADATAIVYCRHE